MTYRVVPFVANVRTGDDATAAANQLQQLINTEAAQGWVYARLENIEIIIHDPGTKGSSGCFGLGATPGIPPSQRTTRYDVAVFQKN